MIGVCSPAYAHLSHCLRVQLAMIQSETMKTSSTVPGQIVMSVLSTKRVLKLIRFSAPIDRELASVNSFECNNITLKKAKERLVILSMRRKERMEQMTFFKWSKSRAFIGDKILPFSAAEPDLF